MIVPMKKLVLIGHRSLRHRLFKELHQSKMVEIVQTRELENGQRLDNSAKIEHYKDNMNRISEMFDFLKDQKKSAETLASKTKKSENPYIYSPIKQNKDIQRINYEEFEDITTKEIELNANLTDLEDIKAKQLELISQQTKLKSSIANHMIYKDIVKPYSYFVDTKRTTVVIGCIPANKYLAFKNVADTLDDVVFESYEGSKFVPIIGVTLKENAEKMLTELQNFDFVKLTNLVDKTPEQCIIEAQEKIRKCEQEKINLMTRALIKEVYIQDWKVLYDYYSMEYEKYKSLDGFETTKRSFVLEGWYAADNEQRLKELLDGISDAMVYEFFEPEDDDVVPTYLSNNKVVKPYEGITNMFSPPNYRTDLDPNPVMAFFYFLFFGMMLADAAYGLILAIAAFTYYAVKKPTPGKGHLFLIVGMGGISTFIWGALFGGWFGLDISGTFLAEIQVISPLNQPLEFLGLSLGLGLVHIMTGMMLNAINLCKRKRYLDAFCEVGTWYSIIIGLILVVVGALVAKNDIVMWVGVGILCFGVLTLILSGMRGKKGPKKVLGLFSGVAKLYDGMNLLSDVLSYARLFGLGLSGGVIGMVINTMCGILIDAFPPNLVAIGYILCIPLFCGGHLFNIAISTLGAYVHNCRLQYIEFFGKFYEGGGHTFVPFATNTKYVYIETPEEYRGLPKQTKQKNKLKKAQA